MVQILFPSVLTYFIAYTDSKKCAWGKVKPTQQMQSGQPKLYQTTVEGEWLAELQNFYVKWGYRFNKEADAIAAAKKVNDKYGQGTVTVQYAEYNNPKFWYILGSFTDLLNQPVSFQVLPQP
jgi:hypothetical protein